MKEQNMFLRKNRNHGDKKSISDGFDSVSVLNKYEYNDFDYIQYIKFSKSIVALGPQTFRYCRQLRRIDVSEENEFFSSQDGVLFDKIKETLICYPANRIGSSYVVPDSVKRIENYAFSGSRLEEVKLNDGLLEIGDCAFQGCGRLSEIIFPTTLESIGYVVFSGCNGIKHFLVTKSIRHITFPTLPDYLETIEVSEDHDIFLARDNVLFSKDMTSLFKMPGNFCCDVYRVPNSVRKIAGHAFAGCTKVKRIIIPNSVNEIGEYAFADMKDNQIIQIPERLCLDKKEFSSPFSLSKALIEKY